MRPDVEGALARAKAATPGPWHHDALILPGRVTTRERGGGAWVFSHSGDRAQETADGDFAAHARLDVPALAHRVLALEVALRETVAALGAVDHVRTPIGGMACPWCADTWAHKGGCKRGIALARAAELLGGKSDG